MMAPDREIDEVRKELEALQAAFAAQQHKSFALVNEVRTAQAELASRVDESNVSENIVDRPIYVTPARRIDKFRGQPLKSPLYTSGWQMPEACWPHHISCDRQVTLPYLSRT